LWFSNVKKYAAKEDSILRKRISAAITCALLLTGCGADGDLYSPREKNDLLTPKETETSLTEHEDTKTETETTDIEALLIQPETTVHVEDITTLTEEPVDFGSESYGYYREQLTGYEQKAYDEIYKAIAQCSDTVDLDRTFETDDIKRIVRCLKEDHTELFWIGKGYSTLTGSDYTKITFDIITAVDRYDYTDYVQSLNNEVNNILSRIPDNASTYEKVLTVHDIIVNNTDYACDYYTKSYEESEMYYNAYGCLVDHYSVCDGYSKAFKLLMDKLGIRCGIVSGKSLRSTEGHSWNYVEIDGEYYWLDVTWDDPVSNNPGEVNRDLLHTYFCITDEQLLRDHSIDESLSLFIPQCTSDRYNYMKMNGCYLETYSFEDFDRIFRDFDNEISVQFGSADAYYAAFSDLIDNNNIYNTKYMKEKNRNSFSYSPNEEQYILKIIVK
jgi:transglutaminase/protease-like cytokinesis protein 3